MEYCAYTLLFCNFYSSPNINNDQVRKDEMGWTQITHGGNEKFVKIIQSENQNGRLHLADLRIDKMDLKEVGYASVDCIHLAQDTDQ
jgi:hypothetical protein